MKKHKSVSPNSTIYHRWVLKSLDSTAPIAEIKYDVPSHYAFKENRIWVNGWVYQLVTPEH